MADHFPTTGRRWSTLSSKKTKKVDQTIHFTTGLCSRKAGYAADPLDQLEAKGHLTTIAKDVFGIDPTRFNLFLLETNVPDKVIDEVLLKLPAWASAPRPRYCQMRDVSRRKVTGMLAGLRTYRVLPV